MKLSAPFNRAKMGMFWGFLFLLGSAQAKDWGDLPATFREKYFPSPAYPLNALASGIGGRVVLEVEGLHDGHIKKIHVRESSGEQLIDLGVRKWIYENWSFPKTKILNEDLTRVEIALNFQPDAESRKKAQALLEKIRNVWYEKIKESPYPQNEYFPRPFYPYEAKENRWQGKVLVRVKANPSGQPVLVKVLKSSGHTVLDKNTVEWILFHWNFVNQTHGKNFEVEIPVNYELTD